MTRRTEKCQAAPRRSPASLGNLKRGHAVGTKLGRRGKGLVRGSPAASRSEIRRLLAAAGDAVPKLERQSIEREFVTLGTSQDRLRQLIEAGTCTTEDQREHRRLGDRMNRIRARLNATLAVEQKRAPLDASDRAAFCAAHLTVADGGPFSLVGREWQRDQFWAPLDGYRLWLVDPEHACDACRAQSGEIVSSVYEADASRTPKHAASGCRGLDAHMITLVLLQLRRQQGKTTAVAGFAISSLWRHARESIAYITGSENQSEALFRANFGTSVATSESLGKRARVLRTRLVVPETESEFCLYPTSLAGVTGGSSTLVIVDEARDVPSSVFGAFVPRVFARNGWRCPSGRIGHAWSSGDLQISGGLGQTTAVVDPGQPQYGAKCPVCGERLQPWSGRVAAMSSAQVLDGSDADWFHTLCESLEKDPVPVAHVFRSTRIVNPKVSQQLVASMEAVLSRVPGLADVMAIEASGISKRKNEPYLTQSEIAACLSKRVIHSEAGSRPGVAFLDLSDSGDTSSLVITEDDSDTAEGESPWARIVAARVDVFDPKEKNHPIVAEGLVNDRALEEYLDELVPRFKLLRLRVDDRHAQWTRVLVAKLRRKPWGRIVVGCSGVESSGGKRFFFGKFERRAAYNEMARRFKGRLLIAPDLPELRQELVGARGIRDENNEIDVREAGSRHKRGVRHLDIAESLACCCYDVQDISSRGTGGASMADVAEVSRATTARPGSIEERIARVKQTITGGLTRGPESY